MAKMLFAAKERERVGVLVNNICFFATQLIQQTSADLTRRALANLATVKKDDEDLLKCLDELARGQGEESPQRLIEDLARMPSDAVQLLTVLRRCMLVSSFLGRCIAEPSPESPGTELTARDRVH
jgi:hypothetical protein